MTIKIGILGCQSKHAEFFGSLFNVTRDFPGFSAPFIFGNDAPSRLAYVCDTAKIPHICQNAAELINQSDAVLITYRLGDRHFEPAMACLHKEKPVFVDKPFTLDPNQAQTLAEVSLKKGVPLMGGSTLSYDPQLQAIKRKAFSAYLGMVAYRVDPNSPFGGYRFYGSHLTDLCAAVFHTGAEATKAFYDGEAINVLVHYPERTVILHSHPDFKKPEVTYSENVRLASIELDDINCYKHGMQAFVSLIKSDKPDPETLSRLVFSTQLLNSIIESLETGMLIKLVQ